ncbi:interferon-activable protein 203-like [Peromyscus californicus insignis]|uniref:interferon-activable protein 203-like n=1 Tax=Peromyscus californicus insignis TaxID=564181 RepID=UPI0022A7F0BC|nr:interferon-activable protein 203-like [Peromyscus californicus insignis]
MSEYKTIVLQQGLEDVAVDDYQFRKIKSLLRKELNLTKKMQDDYDRIQMADLLEDTFPKDAGLDKLIEVCQSIKDLEDLAQRLKTERGKVKVQKKGKNKTAVKRRKQEEPSSSRSLSTDNESDKSEPSAQEMRKETIKIEGSKKMKLTQEQTQLPEPSGSNTQKDEGCLQTPQKPIPTPSSSSSNKTPNNGNLPKKPSKIEGHHRVAKEVMVLKVTEPFTYDLINNKRMFHATVATETEFFRVKVFDTALKNKFIPQNVITISDYTGVSGFLEIRKASCVSDDNVNQTMVISNTLRRRANGTPKIKDLFSQTKGTYVNGEFEVTKKNERGDFIYYGIEDDTGKMEVVVSGPLTCIKCEPGNKVQLICFQLTSREDTWQLKSVRHSYMQVSSMPEGRSFNPDSIMNTSLEPYF